MHLKFIISTNFEKYGNKILIFSVPMYTTPGIQTFKTLGLFMKITPIKFVKNIFEYNCIIAGM